MGTAEQNEQDMAHGAAGEPRIIMRTDAVA